MKGIGSRGNLDPGYKLMLEGELCLHRLRDAFSDGGRQLGACEGHGQNEA